MSVDYQVSRKFRRELRRAFRLLDKDDDGTISTAEMGAVLRNLGQYPTISELNEVLREIDINGDGTFTFEEFVQFTANVGGGSSNSEEEEEEELRQTFKLFDKSKCGYIMPSDLQAVLQCMGEELTEEEIDEMIAEVDIDGDGRIGYEEFLACMRGDDDDGKDDEEESESDDDDENNNAGKTSTDEECGH